jgi:hypothetical protein
MTNVEQNELPSDGTELSLDEIKLSLNGTELPSDEMTMNIKRNGMDVQ